MSLFLRFVALLSLVALAPSAYAQSQGTLTQTSVSCGSTSTTLLAANSAKTFLKVKVPNAATQTVWIDWSGNAAVVAPPSEDFSAGSSIVFYRSTGFLPLTIIKCIVASGSQTVTLEYQ